MGRKRQWLAETHLCLDLRLRCVTLTLIVKSCSCRCVSDDHREEAMSVSFRRGLSRVLARFGLALVTVVAMSSLGGSGRVALVAEVGTHLMENGGGRLVLMAIKAQCSLENSDVAPLSAYARKYSNFRSTMRFEICEVARIQPYIGHQCSDEVEV